MRISGPTSVSALVLIGLLLSGSAAHTTTGTADGVLTAAIGPGDRADSAADQSIYLPSATGDPSEQLQALTPPEVELLPDGTIPLQEISVPGDGTRGIPEIVLAAYRNAELTLQASTPDCGLPWHLLAGIGKVESDHAGNGRTDANGTTTGVIYGPALDGTLPDNEVIQAADGSYVRAVGPMQFLPGTWSIYASDGNGDNASDPNNVFDATVAAGKYLCSGGLDLRDPAQETRAVLRYNNSLDYASQVLSWSNAYKTGGTPVQVEVADEIIPPGSTPEGDMPEGAGSSMSVGETTVLAAATDPADPAADPPNSSTEPLNSTTEPPSTTPAPDATATGSHPTATLQLSIRVTINVPGRAPIPCGIFCPPRLPKQPQPSTQRPTTTAPATPTTTPPPRTPTTTPEPAKPTTTAPPTTPPPPKPSTTPTPAAPPQSTSGRAAPGSSNQPQIAPAPTTPTPAQQAPRTPTTPTQPAPPKPPAPAPSVAPTPAAPAPPAPGKPTAGQPTNQQAPAPAPATPAPEQKPQTPATTAAPAPAQPPKTTPPPTPTPPR
ncbi:lytic transglycosylase domain-containing protein [Nocardia brasiliensis]|uniref:lytic transglycosylase domain-containing protein n=1 Tax=Nocardia brasiliensis TaxID=37326 RepID=UPI0036707F28